MVTMQQVRDSVSSRAREALDSEPVRKVAEAVGDEETLAQGLAWFSIGLGLAEIAAAEQLADYFGLEGSSGLLRLFGFREIGAGAGILMGRKAAPWLWARVGGDVLDLLALSSGLKRSNPKRGRLAIATAAVAGITALDVLCGWRLWKRDE